MVARAAAAEDVPPALARGIHLASLPPRGPVFVSIPMDDWDAEVDPTAARAAIARGVAGRAAPTPTGPPPRRALDAASNPALVVGPDVDAAGGWDAAVAPRRAPAPAGLGDARRPGGGVGFPEHHPNFRGVLPPAIGPVAQTLEGHDLILVVGSSVFPYYPYIPGPLLPEGARLLTITSDPDEAARAPMGDAIVADPGLTLARCSRPCRSPGRRPSPPGPTEVPAEDPHNASTVHSALAEVFPEDGVLVLESPSSTARCHQLRLSRPGSYYFSAGGGLGFGLAGRGRRPARRARPPGRLRPRRRLAAVRGHALWSAVAYEVPVTFLVLRNPEYAILKWFAEVESVTGAPGLDLPALDVAAVAAGYGVSTRSRASATRSATPLPRPLASSQAGAGRSPGAAGHVPLLDGDERHRRP